MTTEQLELVPAPARPRRRAAGPSSEVELAERDPVATVLVDTPLAHLDRPFEYAVPADLAEQARPGVRVKVRFAGRDHDGFLLSRASTAEHQGRLTPLRSVVSPEPVLTPAVLEVAREVADHYGGTLADTVRLAVPPRHARAERSVPERPADPGRGPAPDAAAGTDAFPVPPATAWSGYPAGPALLRRLREGGAPGAAWLALPGQGEEQDWPRAVAEAVAATVAGGRGALVVVPDRRDVERVIGPVTAAVGEDRVVRLTADLGPEARYAAFLRVLRGHAPVVVGTRASAFAPVPSLGLVVCWDEGDDLHQEPRAPYPHVREVLRRRSHREGAGLLVAGFTRSVVVEQWVRQGLLAPVAGERELLRRAAPAVLVAGEGHQEARDAAARTARLPTVAWQALRVGLEAGRPVLVQVPRQGYVLALACQDCRTPVRCARCHGPVGAGDRQSEARCRWCSAEVPAGQTCVECGSARRRATGVGERRTAEELGRAFPGTRVISSGGDRVVDRVDDTAALVVATPGAEPWCRAGYAAVVLLDGWRVLERASLEAQPEALRRWCAAAALRRPSAGGEEGGRQRRQVVLCGVPPHATIPAVEALVRWDPAWLAGRELAERSELGLPPAVRQADLLGPVAAVDEAAQALARAGHVLLGTVPGDDRARATVREAPGTDLARGVRTLRAERSARKAEDTVRMVLDPADQ
ncbi:primosome assembly protein PriA [Serinicoccus kebangsaanensis]|uniref:primosomal protein N' family DNA-binding protein n=1 Tax=Serinicoccus kebangsaanensis TaxID=2602069 RepID=UPI00178C38C9|nr:primosome assembly protein PriA [Serinicoccus kebangsaanensis]